MIHIYKKTPGFEPAIGMTGNGIEVYRLATLLEGLKLELKCPGMRMSSRLPKCTTIARRQYGLKGSPAKLIEQVERLLQEAKAKTTYLDENEGPTALTCPVCRKTGHVEPLKNLATGAKLKALAADGTTHVCTHCDTGLAMETV